MQITDLSEATLNNLLVTVESLKAVSVLVCCAS